MTADQIIELGTKLGIEFIRSSNYDDQIARDMVVFNGVNGQRFLFEGSDSDDEIYKQMGRTLILIGERRKKMEINRVLNIMSD